MSQSIEASILQSVEAEAKDKLNRAMQRRDLVAAKSALQEIVEAKLQDPKMPRQRITRNYPGIGGASVAWRWVTATGNVTLVANVPAGKSWDSIVLSAFVTYPGVRTRPRLVFRNSIQDPGAFSSIVEQAIHQIVNLGLLRP